MGKKELIQMTVKQILEQLVIKKNSNLTNLIFCKKRKYRNLYENFERLYRVKKKFLVIVQYTKCFLREIFKNTVTKSYYPKENSFSELFFLIRYFEKYIGQKRKQSSILFRYRYNLVKSLLIQQTNTINWIENKKKDILHSYIFSVMLFLSNIFFSKNNVGNFSATNINKSIGEKKIDSDSIQSIIKRFLGEVMKTKINKADKNTRCVCVLQNNDVEKFLNKRKQKFY